MLWSCDRREGDVVVLIDEDGNSRNVSADWLPVDAREGAMLRQVGESFVFDEAATEARRKRALALQQRLRRKNER